MMQSDPLIRWRLTGLLATLVIVLSIPFYMVRERHQTQGVPVKADIQDEKFIGSKKCQSCHRAEYDKWRDSHHRWAMETANEETVRGDFHNVEFDYFGTVSRFFRKNGKFYVTTQGPGGKMADFEITHTFGWYPLQQYLIPFPGGRLQCLPIAWDVKEKRWFHLYPDEPFAPDDWLYWTRNGQNWNGMCAECHSTHLKKNYDPEKDVYTTTWSEISIGCEACHGPGADHAAWAEMPEMGRTELPNFGLSVTTRNLTSRQLNELCAPCHSRRMSLGDNRHTHRHFMDYAIPQLLSEGRYFPDGQILDEVYVYGSFMQSKMYSREVRCSDCHDVHSIRRIKKGNDLCLQCHKAAVYDTAAHHFHKKKGEKGEPVRSADGKVLFEVGTGAQCEQCHMPGRIYMGVDYRPDHSFRIPRPDLSLTMETPNACNRCHTDKTNQWSVDYLAKWYGERKRPHYGTILYAGRQQAPEALNDLKRLSEDRLYSPIVRATALSLLAGYPAAETEQTFINALSDETDLMRWAALRHQPPLDPKNQMQQYAPLLYDPVKSVRIEAAVSLAGIPPEQLPAEIRKKLAPALNEYELAMRYTADFAPSRHNLGNLYASQGEDRKAILQYEKAIEIDGQFYPAKVNLAMLYNRLKQNGKAEKLFREVVADHPELHDIKYSLGLLLVENHKLKDALIYMKDASAFLPQRSRIHYNLALLLQQFQRFDEAENAFKKALTAAPDHPDYLYALAVFYINRQRFKEAEVVALQLSEMHPELPKVRKLLSFIRKHRKP